MYAVFETGGKQYRASAGDTVTVEKLDAEAGKPFTFDRVLLVSNDGQVTVGSPLVEKANVVADVVEHKRGPKLIAFKMKRRKGNRRKVGHRRSSAEGDPVCVGIRQVGTQVEDLVPRLHQRLRGVEVANLRGGND